MTADDLAQLIATQFGWDEFPKADAIATWVGHAFLHATGRNPNADDLFYNVKDLRRAVAYLRVVGLTGYGTGKTAARLHARVREMAAWHAVGAITVSRRDGVEDPFIDWVASEFVPDMLLGYLAEGSAFLVIPCEVDVVGSTV